MSAAGGRGRHVGIPRAQSSAVA